MEHSLLAADAAVRPWRTAAYVAGGVALLELLLLLALGGGALASALADRIQIAARDAVLAPETARAEPSGSRARKPAKATPPVATRPRGKTVILVLNGN
ncbi:MAG: hypothetical protein NZL88_07625, partial [Gaiellaceae bacterium]|nr:hypothetical protein [Gaiellaceae bacterium]